MATHAGSEGIVKIGTNVIAETKSWTIEESSDTVDASIIGTEWRKHQATIKSWNGSLECFWDEADATGQGALTVGATVALKLYPEGDDAGAIYFSGNVIVTGISRSASFDGLVEASFSFTGTGALTQSTVA